MRKITESLALKVQSFYLRVSKNKETNITPDTNNQNLSTQNGHTKTKSGFFKINLIYIFGFLLLSWFLLFGNALSFYITIIGVVISGIFLLIIAYKILLRTKPSLVDKPPVFNFFESIINFFIKHEEGKKKNAYTTQNDIETSKTSLNLSRWILHKILKMFRGNHIQELIYFIVLLEFTFTLLLVTASSVIFWGLIIKTISPSSLNLLDCLYASLTFYLPNLDFPQLPSRIPNWIKIGNSLTAWFLWVVYVGLAINLIPKKLNSYLHNLEKIKKLYKETILEFKNELKTLNVISNKIPKQLVNTKESLKQ